MFFEFFESGILKDSLFVLGFNTTQGFYTCTGIQYDSQGFYICTGIQYDAQREYPCQIQKIQKIQNI